MFLVLCCCVDAFLKRSSYYLHYCDCGTTKRQATAVIEPIEANTNVASKENLKWMTTRTRSLYPLRKWRWKKGNDDDDQMNHLSLLLCECRLHICSFFHCSMISTVYLRIPNELLLHLYRLRHRSFARLLAVFLQPFNSLYKLNNNYCLLHFILLLLLLLLLSIAAAAAFRYSFTSSSSKSNRIGLDCSSSRYFIVFHSEFYIRNVRRHTITLTSIRQHLSCEAN